MSDSYRLRFIGRFVFAYEGDTEHPKRVTALAMRMTANPDLQCDRHRSFLTAPRSHAKALGVRQADTTVFAPTDKVEVGAQLFTWDLEGHDVWPMNLPRTQIQTYNWGAVPDVGRLASPQFPATRWASPPQPFAVGCIKQMPPPPAVGMRFSFPSGKFSHQQFDPLKKASFEPLGQGEPYQDPIDDLPDVVHVDLEVDGPLYLGLVRHADGLQSSIAITPAEAPRVAPLIVTVTNLCTKGGSNTDREFAAFYDVLENPPRPRERRIPYASEEPEEGADGDCSPYSTVQYL